MSFSHLVNWPSHTVPDSMKHLLSSYGKISRYMLRRFIAKSTGIADSFPSHPSLHKLHAVLLPKNSTLIVDMLQYTLTSSRGAKIYRHRIPKTGTSCILPVTIRTLIVIPANAPPSSTRSWLPTGLPSDILPCRAKSTASACKQALFLISLSVLVNLVEI